MRAGRLRVRSCTLSEHKLMLMGGRDACICMTSHAHISMMHGVHCASWLALA